MSEQRRRRRPNATEREAAALLTIKRGDRWLIPEPLRSTGTAQEIVSSVEWDHQFPWALGGGNEPQNLKPYVKESDEHRRKTHGVKHGFAGSDRHKVNKGKRMRAKYAEAGAVEAKRDPTVEASPPRPAGKIASRPLPGTKASGQRRRMNGTVEKW